MSASAVRDALAVSTAQAERIQSDLRQWLRREGRSAAPAARLLARLGQSVAERMLAQAHQLRDALPGGTVGLDDIESLHERARSAEALHKELESSSHKALHPVFSPTLKFELKRLGVAGAVLVSGTRDLLYELDPIVPSTLPGLVVPGATTVSSEPVFIFRVPNVPLDWPLHHVLIYHELGHAKLMQAPETLVEPKIPFEIPPFGDPEHDDKFAEARAFVSMSQSWFTELYSDAVGALLAGPAYFFAFARLFGAVIPINEATRVHPPLAWRLRLLADLLTSQGLMPSGTYETELAESWLKFAAMPFASDRLSKQMLQMLADDAARAYPEIMTKALADTSGVRMTPERLERNKLRADDLRNHGIPTIEENGSPLDPADIFDITWQAFLQDESARPFATRSAERADYYARVLLAALDGAEAMRVWRAPA